jgi:HPt (histidine-containing phosphotransfer) domain-containing protein
MRPVWGQERLKSEPETGFRRVGGSFRWKSSNFPAERKNSLTQHGEKQARKPARRARFTAFWQLSRMVAIYKTNVGEDVVSQSNLMTVPVQEPMPTTIDEAHLERMTLGDRSLEREVLEIFARQTAMTLERIGGAGPARVAAAAHTLKGSASGIGAWRVARAAERLEQAAAGKSDEKAITAAIAELEAASFEARTVIGLRLGKAA